MIENTYTVQQTKQELKHRERFEGIARHIEGTEMCMLTLPCKYTDKRVMFYVEEL
jgi:hypothetical protein